jgi:hypothetical protein
MTNDDAILLPFENLVYLVSQPDASSLRLVMWLHDIPLVLFILDQLFRLFNESTRLGRQNVGFGDEIKMIEPVASLHFRYIAVHQILACNFKRLWEMVDLLVSAKGLQSLRLRYTVVPYYTEIVVAALNKAILLQQVFYEANRTSNKFELVAEVRILR